MKELLSAFAIQILASAGVIALFGALVALLRRAFCSLLPKAGPKILLATGLVGTPIHELSHALMCLIFGHKIKEIKLYQPSAPNGNLGYVTHSYNKKNVYHQIGNFFIGTAPVLLGGGVILLLMLLLLPDSAHAMFSRVSHGAGGAAFFSLLIDNVFTVFDPHVLAGTRGFIFALLAIMIASHMELSGADIKSSAAGFGFICAILLAVDTVVYLISPDALGAISSAFLSFALIYSAFFSIALAFLLGLLLIALIFWGIGKLFGK